MRPTIIWRNKTCRGEKDVLCWFIDVDLTIGSNKRDPGRTECCII